MSAFFEELKEWGDMLRDMFGRRGCVGALKEIFNCRSPLRCWPEREMSAEELMSRDAMDSLVPVWVLAVKQRATEEALLHPSSPEDRRALELGVVVLKHIQVIARGRGGGSFLRDFPILPMM